MDRSFWLRWLPTFLGFPIGRFIASFARCWPGSNATDGAFRRRNRRNVYRFGAVVGAATAL